MMSAFAAALLFYLTGLTQCRTQTPLSLRQQGTSFLSAFRFLCSASAKNETQKKIKYRCKAHI
jgi:hypothetical protein